MIGYAGVGRNSVMMLGETIEHKDARLIAMSSEIHRWPGYYDLYRPTFSWRPTLAWAFICRAAGSPYSFRHISRGAVRRFIASAIPPIPNSDLPQWPRSCSALVHAAMRCAGGPILREYDCDVSPADLSDARFFRYIATLYWSQHQIDGLTK